MKNTVIVLAASFLLLACNQKTPEVESLNPKNKNLIVGSWKLVYADILENDSLQVKELNKIDFIKIMNSTHFAFFNQEQGTDENFVAGGGTYSFDGTNYIETLDFINTPDYRGHVFPFEVEIKGDSLIQRGHEKIEAVGLDRYILEKYIRIKSQN
jgi:hypothetical protein